MALQAFPATLPPHNHILRCTLIRASGGVGDAEGDDMAAALDRALVRAWGPSTVVSLPRRVSGHAIEAVAVACQEWGAADQRRALEDALVAFSHESLSGNGEFPPGSTSLQWIFSQKTTDGRVLQGTTLDIHGGPLSDRDVARQVRSPSSHIYQGVEDLGRLLRCIEVAAAVLVLRTSPGLRAPCPSRPASRL